MSEEQPAQTLGTFFGEYEFPSVERSRIAKAAKRHGLPADILKKYSQQTELYKEFAKREKIHGFRAGRPGYFKQALRKVIGYMGGPDNCPQYKICWDIYHHATIDYLQTELSGLQQLLLEVPKPESDDVAELLRELCKNAFEYGVMREDVQIFYEIWGVDRVDDIEGILALCDTHDEEDEDKRSLREMGKAIGDLKTSVERLGQQLSTHEGENEATHKEVDRNEKRLLETEKAVRACTANLVKISENLAKKVSSSKKEDAGVGKLAVRISTAEKELGKLLKSVPTLKQEIKNATVKVEKGSKETASATTSITQRLEKLEGELAGMVTSMSSKNSSATSETSMSKVLPYRSPLIRPMGAASSQCGEEFELDFVESWRNRLQKTEGMTLNFPQALALHRAFLANRVVTAGLPFVFSWVRQLGWDQFTLNLSASPTWSCEEDWECGAEHLFVETNSLPRCLIIHNYDLGLMDCYLAPSLVLWALQTNSSPLSKLFLVPSQPPQLCSRQVLEHTAYLAREQIDTERISLGKGRRSPAANSGKTKRGVDPKSVLKWARESEHVKFDLVEALLGKGLKLSPTTAMGFRKTAESLSHYFAEASSIEWAARTHILPCFQSTCDDESLNAANEVLASLGNK